MCVLYVYYRLVMYISLDLSVKYIKILGLVGACDNLSACLFVYLPHDFHFHVLNLIQPALCISYIAF